MYFKFPLFLLPLSDLFTKNSSMDRRIRTHHFAGPNDYEYQEMGPMRFPEEVIYKNETLPINDHKLVFDLASYLNNMNHNDTRYRVDWIPWYQTNANGNNLVYMGGIRKADGSVPTQNDIDADPSLKYTVDNGAEMTAEVASIKAFEDATFYSDEELMAVANNMFEAHSQFISEITRATPLPLGHIANDDKRE